MSKKIQRFLVLLVLILFNVYSLVCSYRYKHQRDDCVQVYTDQKNMNPAQYDYSIKVGLLNNGKQLKKLQIKDTSNHVMSLKEVFQGGQEYILICRFSKHHCESCVDHSIKMILNRNNKMNMSRILFMGNYGNIILFKREMSLYANKEMRISNASTIDIPAEDIGYPYYLIVDKDLKITDIFVPQKDTPQFTNSFLKLANEKITFANSVNQ